MYDPENRPKAIGMGRDALKECASFVTPKLLEKPKTLVDPQSVAKSGDFVLPNLVANAYSLDESDRKFTLYSYVMYFEPNQDNKHTR